MKKSLVAFSVTLTLLTLPLTSEAMALKNFFSSVDDKLTEFLGGMTKRNSTPEREINRMTDPPGYNSGSNCQSDSGGNAGTEQFDGSRMTKKEDAADRLLFPFDVRPEDKLLYANYTKMGGDPVALKQALCFQRTYGDVKFRAKGDASRNGIAIKKQRYITINDLNKRSDNARMYVLDTQTGDVKAYYSAHGSGGKNGTGANNPYEAEYYSNKNGSLATPRGFFIAGSTYYGKYGYSMRMHGLQEGINDNSFSRAVVMHGFEGMNTAVASSHDDPPTKNLKVPGNVATSWGCTMLAPERAREAIDTLKDSSGGGGSLYYNYTQEERALGEDYCGNDNLMIKR